MTFLLAWIDSCADADDPPAPRVGPATGATMVLLGVGNTVPEAVGCPLVLVAVAPTRVVMDRVAKTDAVMTPDGTVVLMGGTTGIIPPGGQKLPETELYPAFATKPFVLTVLPLLRSNGSITVPDLDTWMRGELTWNVQDWFQALKSNWICPSSVFKWTVGGDEVGPVELRVELLGRIGVVNPTAARISPLTLTTDNCSRTITDRRMTDAGVEDEYEMESALTFRDYDGEAK